MSYTPKDISVLVTDFLKRSLEQNEIPEDNKESIEFAIESINDAFNLDSELIERVLTKTFKHQSLEKLIGNVKDAGEFSNSEAVPVHVSQAETETKDRAEALKLEGNRAMAKREFEQAIEKYSAALELAPANAVYLSNRAAAYSSIGKHDQALVDAQKATESEPSYAKAWSRMGLAKYALGDVEGSMNAYDQGLKVEGNSPSDAMKKGYETAKRKYTEQLADSLGTTETEETPGSTTRGSDIPDLASLANMFGGSSGSDQGASGGAGGLGGLAGLMNNPQVMQAAQRMMQNPEAMNGLLNNPQLRQMAQNFGLGNDSNLEDLMNNPMLQNLANQFRGGPNPQ
ncbi:hypothetical protein OGAPHI_000170 [Ogataea philodendri]|uniref:SGTA homodimerisation domain-containing protein n=1 Tax=Ogataea philodendri TaxID=1378263 RepID=A0A9P8PIN9_9ASCO|nr:uncharacterized protein OGAPHI_000170 [Ogataea philodendri]KAH3671984.1 hypothetical protein OGAPHI_000170 [Ogataea philodendri]